MNNKIKSGILTLGMFSITQRPEGSREVEMLYIRNFIKLLRPRRNAKKDKKHTLIVE